MTQRWKNRPPGSNWGDFGPDDQRGRLNLITSEKVLQGIAEVKAGKTFCLSLPLDYPGGNKLNPRRYPPRLYATRRGGHANFNFPFARENPDFTDVACDDAVLLHLQYSTQWDSLTHIGAAFDADGDGVPETVYYNGFRGGEEIVGPPADGDGFEGPRAQALGIENMAETGVQGRAVLIDLRRKFGDERVAVDHDMLMAVCAEQNVVVEPGDMVLLHTGFADVILGMRHDPDTEKLARSCPALDGRDPKLLQWITDSGLAVLAADNYAVEDFPSRPGKGRHAALPLHEHCLFKLGIHLGELWYLTELAQWLHAQGRNRFLLTAPPLRLPGAVGSPATPVATV